MDEITSALDSIGTAGLVGIGLLFLVEITLMVTALVSLVRTPAEHLRAPKWVWALVVVFVNMIGPIVYFALARKPAAVDLTPAYRSEQAKSSETVADLLYGDVPADGSDGPTS